MKKILALILTLVLLVGVLASMTCAVGAASTNTPSWDNDGDGVLSILAIGNSFSDDAMEYVYNIAHSLGIEQIYLGRLYIGSCTLEMHRQNAEGNAGVYTYYYNTSGEWVKVSGKSMLYALNRHSWDFVTLQQQSGRSGLPETYNGDLTYLINYVKKHENAVNARLAWHMTWAYQQNSTKADFDNYNNSQKVMYNAIISTVQSKIVTNANFSYVIPSGTAVQNARTSIIGDTMTRDGYHMSRPYGRYVTGLTFVKTLTGLDISGIEYAPTGVSDVYKQIAIESVNNAAAKPFAVTQSAFTGDTPLVPKGYIQLKTPMYKGAFWHPQKAGRYNELITDQDNSPNFFTTIRFTKEELPVGSIILLNGSGYQYRPDGWVTDTLQSGTRKSNTTERQVTVTDAWWGNYTIRSFNVSRTNGTSVMGLTDEEMRAIFQIYVPEDAHTHRYENDTCNLCGATLACVSHQYDNACDTDCNNCGEARTVADHVYDNASDPDCNECGAVRTITPAKKNGWVSNGGKWYYYENDVMVKSAWRRDSIGWVYLAADGAMKTNAWVRDSIGWCYVGANGYAVTNCWKKDSVGWCYLNASGSMTKNAWVKDGGKLYYVNASGYKVVNGWARDSKGWVYLGSDGTKVINKWVRDSIGWCYVGADGYAVTNCWKKDSVGWCYLNASGSMTKNAWVNDGGNRYYLNGSGYRVTGTKVIDGKTYKFNSNGILVS